MTPKSRGASALVGMEPVPMTIEAFSAYVDSQIAKAAKMQTLGDKPN